MPPSTSIFPSLRFLTCCSVLALMLSGCASFKLTPDPTEIASAAEIVADVQPPQAWAIPVPDALPTTDWVRAFPDPTLINLVDEALRKNTSIGSAYASLEAAIAGEKVSRADRVPRVSGSGGLSRTERVEPFIPDNTSLSAAVNASWEPDLWNRISDQINLTEIESSAIASDIAAARLSITGQVAQSWFSMIEARLLVDLSQSEIQTLERALRLTQRRFESGVVGSSDVRLARSSLAQAKALQSTRKQQLASITRQTEIFLSRYPANSLAAAKDLPALPPLTGAGAPAYILTQRPDLIAAERRLAAQGIEIDLARKALLPSLSLTGSTSAAGDGLASFFDLDALVANLAANLTAPIFQGGRLRANVEVQEAILKQQLESYVGTVLDAYLDVENALDGELRLAEQEDALRVAAIEALKAEERLELRYSEGLVTILQLLDAQTRRLSAEGQLISARAERLQNRVRLHVALGGGAYGDIPPDALPAFLRDQG